MKAPKIQKDTLRKVLRYIRPYWALVGISILLAAVTVAASLYIPILTGGAVEVLGVHGYFITNMTSGYGFDGVAIAVMGQYTPLGTVVSALIFGALRAGSTSMNRMTSIPGEFIQVLQALVILFVSTPGIVRMFLKKRRQKKEA